MTKHSKVLAFLLAFSFILVISGIAQLQAEEKVVCPGCGHMMQKSEAKISYEYKGKTYYFCCEGCKEKFAKNPEEYLKKKAEMKEVYTCPMHPEVKLDKAGKCPKCGMKLEKKMMPKEKMMHKEHMDKEHMHMKAEEKACCPMMEMMSSKDVEMNIENLKDGIAVKITSKNAEVAKKLQEMSAKMKEMCKHKEESAKKEVKKEEVKKQ
jgi:YHS domain-containing protein